MRSFSIILAAKKVAADFALNSIVKLYNAIHKSIKFNKCIFWLSKPVKCM